MKVLIVYDSAYGNTEKIARSIGSAFNGDVKVLRASEVGPSDIEALDLLIIGSPTYGGRPTPPIQNFLKEVAEPWANGNKVAAFDTRMSAKWVKIFGFAAGRIANRLQKKGAIVTAPPEGFFVKGAKGPLKEGEVERAAVWAKGITASS